MQTLIERQIKSSGRLYKGSPAEIPRLMISLLEQVSRNPQDFDSWCELMFFSCEGAWRNCKTPLDIESKYLSFVRKNETAVVKNSRKKQENHYE